jgi:ribosomal protein S18 acetylase RimI-like enzyme
MSEQDWADKVELHRAVPQGPDGHRSRADDWSEMERGKCRAGFMEPFLIIHRQQVCGSVNLASSGRLGRLKNLVIHPEWRRQGIGAGAAREIARLARDRGKPAAGCFAMEHGQAVGMYRNAGYFPVGRQTEWYRKLS